MCPFLMIFTTKIWFYHSYTSLSSGTVHSQNTTTLPTTSTTTLVTTTGDVFTDVSDNATTTITTSPSLSTTRQPANPTTPEVAIDREVRLCAEARFSMKAMHTCVCRFNRKALTYT